MGLSDNSRGEKSLAEVCRVLVHHRRPAKSIRLHNHVIFVRLFREYEVTPPHMRRSRTGLTSTQVCYALGIEEPTYLDHPNWCNMPWCIYKKTDADRLIDVLAAYTSVRHEVKLLARAEPRCEQLSNADSLLARCQSLDAELQKWIRDFRRNAGGKMYWGYMKIDPVTQQSFCHKFRFTSLKVAMLLLKYWATFILLHSSMMRIEKFVVRARTHLALGLEDPKTFLKPERPYDIFRMYEYSVNICRSLKYALRHDMDSSGPIYLAYPVMAAWLFMKSRAEEQKLRPQQQPEYTWCREKLWLCRGLGKRLFESAMRKDLV